MYRLRLGTIAACVVASLGLGVAPAFAYTYNDSWELYAQNFNTSLLLYNDPCVGNPYGSDGNGESCQWAGANWQFHNWTEGAEETLGTKPVNALCVGLSQADNFATYTCAVASGQYSEYYSGQPGSYPNDNVAVAPAWDCRLSCGKDLVWGWSGQ